MIVTALLLGRQDDFEVRFRGWAVCGSHFDPVIYKYEGDAKFNGEKLLIFKYDMH